MDPRQREGPNLPNQWTPAEMQTYISNYCQKLSMMGVNMWAVPRAGSRWPEPWDPEYKRGAGSIRRLLGGGPGRGSPRADDLDCFTVS